MSGRGDKVPKVAVDKPGEGIHKALNAGGSGGEVTKSVTNRLTGYLKDGTGCKMAHTTRVRILPKPLCWLRAPSTSVFSWPGCVSGPLCWLLQPKERRRRAAVRSRPFRLMTS